MDKVLFYFGHVMSWCMKNMSLSNKAKEEGHSFTIRWALRVDLHFNF